MARSSHGSHLNLPATSSKPLPSPTTFSHLPLRASGRVCPVHNVHTLRGACHLSSVPGKKGIQAGCSARWLLITDHWSGSRGAWCVDTDVSFPTCVIQKEPTANWNAKTPAKTVFYNGFRRTQTQRKCSTCGSVTFHTCQQYFQRLQRPYD